MQRIMYLLTGCVLLCWVSSCKKTDVIQPTLFNKVYGGTQADAASGIAKSADGGYVVAGSTPSNDKDVSGNHGLSDMWVFKIDKNGTLVWQRTLGGSSYDEANAIVASPDGGYVMAGFTQSSDGDVTGHRDGKLGDYDFWVVKVDKNGNLVWQKDLGGSAIDNALALVKSPDGGYVVAGYTQSSDGDVTKFQGQVDAWIVKLSESGNKVWEKTFGGTDADFASAITVIPGGGYLIAGQTQSNNGDVAGNHGGVDAWLLAIDVNGNKMWQKTYGGTGNDYAYSVCVSSDGTYTIGVDTESNNGDVSGNHGATDIWIINTDQKGNILWKKTFGGSQFEKIFSITTTPAGGYAFAATVYSNDGDVHSKHNIGDGWVVLLDKSGNLVREKAIGGNDTDAATAIISIGDENFAVAGYTDSKDGDITSPHGTTDAWAFTTQVK